MFSNRTAWSFFWPKTKSCYCLFVFVVVILARYKFNMSHVTCDTTSWPPTTTISLTQINVFHICFTNMDTLSCLCVYIYYWHDALFFSVLFDDFEDIVLCMSKISVIWRLLICFYILLTSWFFAILFLSDFDDCWRVGNGLLVLIYNLQLNILYFIILLCTFFLFCFFFHLILKLSLTITGMSFLLIWFFWHDFYCCLTLSLILIAFLLLLLLLICLCIFCRLRLISFLGKLSDLYHHSYCTLSVVNIINGRNAKSNLIISIFLKMSRIY